MAKYSLDTKIGVLLKDPEAVKVLEEFMPGLASSPRIKMVSAMKLRKMGTFKEAGLTDESMEAMGAKLETLG